MLTETYGFFLDLKEKNSRGLFTVTLLDIFGNTHSLNTYKNLYHNLNDSALFYHITYETKTVPDKPFIEYKILKTHKTIERLFDNEQTKQTKVTKKYIEPFLKRNNYPIHITKHQPIDIHRLIKIKNEYLSRPDYYKKHNKHFLSQQEFYLNDVKTIKNSNKGEFFDTYRPPKRFVNLIYSDPNRIVREIDSAKKHYGIKKEFLQISEESYLTQNWENTEEYSLNNLPTINKNLNVDSIFAQVAFREKKIVEFFLYFAISSYMRERNQYTTIPLQAIKDYLKKILNKNRKRIKVMDYLVELEKIRMIKINYNCETLQLLSQKKFVEYFEKKHNAIAKNQNKIENKSIYVRTHDGYKKRYVKDMRNNKIPYPSFRIETPQAEAHDPYDHLFYLNLKDEYYKAYKPYFDISFSRTAKIDMGFIYLLNSSIVDMKSYIYELVISSFGEYHFSRRRIGLNLQISPDTQEFYEQRNQNLQKRYNFTHLSRQYLNSIGESINDLNKLHKVRYSESGNLYLQFGNSFKSKRIFWKKSKKACFLRLSLDTIRKWKDCQPIFTKEVDNPHLIPSFKSLRRSPKRVHEFVTFKNANTCTIKNLTLLSTNRKTWEDFDPFLRLDKNGDRIQVKTKKEEKLPFLYAGVIDIPEYKNNNNSSLPINLGYKKYF